ncbi:MAG: sensor histidine kinase [Aggregatilineales bacterium]
MTLEFLFGVLLLVTGTLVYTLYQQYQKLLIAQQQVNQATQQTKIAEAQVNTHQASLETLQTAIEAHQQEIQTLTDAAATHTIDLQAIQQALLQKDRTIKQLREDMKRSAEDSVQSSALYQTISQVAYDVVFVLDHDFTVMAMNRSAELLFGDKHPIGDKLSDILDAPELDNLVHHAPEEAEGLEEQLLINGRFYRVRTKVVRYAGQQDFIGVAMQDITKLVQLNRARRDMVANISHELGGPIANIRLIIDSLFYDHDKPKRKDSIASLKSIEEEVDALQQLSREMLDLSMIESGQALMKLKEENLLEILEESLERSVDQLEDKNLKVAQHIPDAINVLCDREHIRRVFTNLIRNAIKYSPEDDVISINASTEGDEVTIHVLDNGPGVPAKECKRIFERFYQVDTSRTRENAGRSGGSGLGLAICKHIVEAHEGRIRAENNASGAGGRFLFTLINADMDMLADSDDYRGQHDDGLNKLIESRYPVTAGIETDAETMDSTQPEG